MAAVDAGPLRTFARLVPVATRRLLEQPLAGAGSAVLTAGKKPWRAVRPLLVMWPTFQRGLANAEWLSSVLRAVGSLKSSAIMTSTTFSTSPVSWEPSAMINAPATSTASSPSSTCTNRTTNVMRRRYAGVHHGGRLGEHARAGASQRRQSTFRTVGMKASMFASLPAAGSTALRGPGSGCCGVGE